MLDYQFRLGAGDTAAIEHAARIGHSDLSESPESLAEEEDLYDGEALAKCWAEYSELPRA